MIDRRGFLGAAFALGGSACLRPLSAFGDEAGNPFDRKQMSFMQEMLTSPSPSGYEKPVQKIWEAYTSRYAEVRFDRLGNAIATVNGGGKPRFMLAAHCDEISFMVTFIDDNGFLYFAPMGGFDQGIIPGRRVQVHTSNGPLDGVIGKGPIHLMSQDARNRPSQIKDLCIDIGAKDKDEAESIVAVGDPVTYTYEYLELRNGLAVARGFDDRIGSFIVAEVMRRISESRKLKASVYGVSTVQEEIGLRGANASAFGVDPDVAIAIDVTHATDYPGMDKKQAGDIRLGGGGAVSRGPFLNPVVFDLIMETAKKNNLPCQVEGAPGSTGTDANAIQITRAGVATGLISIPLRYMHTPVETLALIDVENIIRMIVAFAEELTPDMDFIP